MEVILTQPVATRMAKFWSVWNFWIIDDGALGNRIEAGGMDKKGPD